MGPGRCGPVSRQTVLSTMFVACVVLSPPMPRPSPWCQRTEYNRGVVQPQNGHLYHSQLGGCETGTPFKDADLGGSPCMRHVSGLASAAAVPGSAWTRVGTQVLGGTVVAEPSAVASVNGTLYIADTGHHCVRSLSMGSDLGGAPDGGTGAQSQVAIG
jgi:hypothetical protein